MAQMYALNTTHLDGLCSHRRIKLPDSLSSLSLILVHESAIHFIKKAGNGHSAEYRYCDIRRYRL